VIQGVCVVGGGATVSGNVTLLPGSTLAAFSDFTVSGNIHVMSGATLIGGQDPDAGGGASAVFHVAGSVIATQPLGVVIHEATIDGNFIEIGGGGGLTCEPSGIFATVLQSPVFSVLEGSHLGGQLTVVGLRSCWFGITHDQIDGGVHVINDQLADPDAVEILDNRIGGSLVCEGNSMAWDSADIGESLFPRVWEPNTVNGNRVGQCVIAPPLTEGGTSPGSF
jgi:hypothetical protein